MLTCLPLLCVPQELLPRMWTDTGVSRRQRSPLSRPEAVAARRESPRMRSAISHDHPREVVPGLAFYGDPGKVDKEEQTLADRAVTREEFWRDWTAPAREFTAPQPKVADASEGLQLPL